MIKIANKDYLNIKNKNNRIKQMQILSLLIILLTISIITSIISLPNLAYAENLIVTSEDNNDNFITINFLNSMKNNFSINSIQIWVDEDDNLQSFKTEKGWSGKRISDSSIIFTSTKPLSPGNSVKMSIKLDHPHVINWKAVDSDNRKLAGKIYPSDEIDVHKYNNSTPIKKSYKVRIIPTNPNPGSTIRVVGEGFDQNQVYYIHINDLKIRNFKTDEFGKFVTTIKIPMTKSDEMIEATISNDSGFKINKIITIHEDKIHKKALLNDITDEVDINSDLKISGTAYFDDAITIYIKDPTGSIVTTSVTYAKVGGAWYQIIEVPKDGILGEWSIKVTNGKNTSEKKFTVVSSNTMEISAMKSVYKLGETILLNVKGIPNQELNIAMEDPRGIEVFSDVLHVDESKNIIIEIPTNDAFINGTYSVLASQDDSRDIMLIGIGEIPKTKITIKTDKMIYDINSTALIDLYGPKSASISLIIIDQYDETKFSDNVTLESDGRSTYRLDLTEYTPGIYTVVAVRGNSQMSETFSVGLQLGSGPIELHTTKNEYKIGESILILGNSSKNALIHLSMIDHNGNELKTKEIFTDKNGIFSDSTFMIPIHANVGEWIIEARSGSNYSDKKINVIQDIEILSIYTDKEKYDINDIVMINGQGSKDRSILIKITDYTDIIIDELEIFSTDEGKFSTLWKVPTYINTGSYKIEASNQNSVAQITFTVE